MGTLDEAIREHLELKRRGGADPGEVAKLEREAFGPIRREDALSLTAVAPDEDDDPFAAAPGEPAMPEDVAPEGPDALADGGAAALFDAQAAEPSPEHPLSVPFDAAAEAPEVSTQKEPDPPAPAEERPRASATPLPPLEADAPAGGSVRADPEAVAGEHTVEFSALDHAEATEGEPADELEETPDFLEETPEHDRLWFEQKPPRDFDF